MWKSKLGQEYTKKYMEQNERVFKAKLDKMRKEPDNRSCADCASGGTVWASINLGVFLCLRCGSIHRGLGTHVSIPKGCTGTYLWGPDELEAMSAKGNSLAREVYGGDEHRPSPDAGDEAWKMYIRDKYENKTFAPNAHNTKKGIAPVPVSLPRTVQANTLPTAAPVVTTTTEDLICFDFIEDTGSGTGTAAGTGVDTSTTSENKTKSTDPPDFFSEFGL